VASRATLAVAGAAWTSTETVAASLVWVPSETTSEKVSVAGPAGAVKVGLAVLAPLRMTAGPAAWVQL
jgi:hypothetical protein